MQRILVTGGCGFIGSNFIRDELSRYADLSVINLDSLTYAGNLENLADLKDDDRYTFHRGDICDREFVDELLKSEPVDAVVNFAAESHVDRSILDSGPFVQTNIVGTQVLLDACRSANVKRFVQISTDEVYGSLGPKGAFTEETPLAPNSPYSASKTAADLLVRSYCRTFGFPAVITRCSNNYGPYQFPEKVIPLFVTNLLEGQTVPLYGDGMNIRDWIHVYDHCDALMAVLERGEPGRVYNIGGDHELTNLELTHRIIAELGKDESVIERVKDRLGHDRRYAIDGTRIREELGWSPRIDFASGLTETVQWYRQNESWWRAIKTGEYLEYYKLQYGAA